MMMNGMTESSPCLSEWVPTAQAKSNIAICLENSATQCQNTVQCDVLLSQQGFSGHNRAHILI